jgi:hypothetical protein
MRSMLHTAWYSDFLRYCRLLRSYWRGAGGFSAPDNGSDMNGSDGREACQHARSGCESRGWSRHRGSSPPLTADGAEPLTRLTERQRAGGRAWAGVGGLGPEVDGPRVCAWGPGGVRMYSGGGESSRISRIRLSSYPSGKRQEDAARSSPVPLGATIMPCWRQCWLRKPARRCGQDSRAMLPSYLPALQHSGRPQTWRLGHCEP